MDLTRLVTLVTIDLSLENLKLQEELERYMNMDIADIGINTKIFKIKLQLEKLVMNELMVTKFQQILETSYPDNNKNLKPKENG